MNPTLKEHLLSASRVFASTFIVTLATTLQSGVTWSTDFWFPLAVAAVSAAFKAAISAYLSSDINSLQQ
jgi:hypothetical protein